MEGLAMPAILPALAWLLCRVRGYYRSDTMLCFLELNIDYVRVA